MYSEDLKYSKEHEWLKVEEGVGTFGITHFAQQELGDIVYVELPEVGASFAANDVVATVESVKAVSEIFAPVGGEIVAVNEELSDAPEKINEDPHGAGWLCKIKLGDAAEVDALMSAAEYQKLIES